MWVGRQRPPGSSARDYSPAVSPAGPTLITTHGEVDDGTYRIGVAEPPFEFTLEGDGWFVGEPHAGFNGFNLYPGDPDAYVLILRCLGLRQQRLQP